MPSTIILTAKGLSTSPNSLIDSEGGLVTAENVIIRRDNVVESRRGYKLFDEGFGSPSDRAKQIISYKERLIVHYSNILQFQDGVNNDGFPNFTDFNGSYEETEEGLRIKSIEANGNLYFTTSEGIKKISAASASELSAGDISASGGVKALDLTTKVNYNYGDTTGFLPSDSAVAYRVVWGTRDNNENLILGTPSQRAEVYNSLLTTTIQDFQQFLFTLDNIDQAGSYITDGDYLSSLSLAINASASELHTNLIALAAKLDADILYADNNGSLTSGIPFEIVSASISSNVVTLTFDNTTPGAKVSQYFAQGSKIYLAGTWTATGGADISGIRTVANVTEATNVITFNATGNDGAVTIDATSEVESGEFRNITEPSLPSTPATNQELEELQDYLNSIIVALQGFTTQSTIATDSGSGVPLNISTVTIAAGTATVTFSAGDPRDYVKTGDYIYFTGFVVTGTGSVSGLQTVTGTTATTLTFTTAATGTVAVGANDTLDKIITFSNDLANMFVDVAAITTSATVTLTITIPDAITTDYFYQIYRSSIVTADGPSVLADLTPSDELQLVYEAYPTQAEIDAREVVVEDVTPDAFRGANLYTNASTGEGISQANDVPPFAKDINRFKNTVFFANTRTRQRMSLNLLGVTNMIADYENGDTPKVVLSNGTSSNTYSFVTGESQLITVDTVADVSNSLDGKYWLISTTTESFYIWYATSLTTVDPAVSGRTGIRVQLDTNDSAATVAQKTMGALNTLNSDFNAVITTPTDVITVTNVTPGYVLSIADTWSSTFVITTIDAGRGEKATQDTCIYGLEAGSLFVSSGPSNYLQFNTAGEKKQYYVWYQKGTSVDPALGSPYIGIEVPILNTDTASDVVSKSVIAINAAASDYIEAEGDAASLTITSVTYGPADNTVANIANLPGLPTFNPIIQGVLEVLLSSAVSPSVAVDETARSFVRIINKNAGEPVSGFYLSGSQDVPGKMFFESESLSDGTFYFLGNNDNTGASFNPDISPDIEGITTTAGNPTTVTLASHGLTNGDQVVIVNSDSTPIIDGVWSITRVDANSFTIPIHTTANSTTGSISIVENATASSNEEKKNRIYFSKLQQPEAVPLVNYLDVGAEDKAILRIFPLRDSLFVYKEDGLYRISGEVAPFTLALFDSSVVLIAPDSLDVCNNVLYCWTTQGIVPVTEGGASNPISREIDDQILRLGSVNYVNFRTATWGKGYESDNCYKVWTVSDRNDEIANVAYRYNTLTTSWTTFTKTNTCGITNPADDKEYLGAGDTNNIEVERKEFAREDYADREFEITIPDAGYFGDRFSVSDVSEMAEGDVIVQNQTISIYQFNQLLKKLDIDPGVADNDYFNTLEIEAGENMRTALAALATKLDADSGVAQTDYAASIANLNGTISSFSIANPTVITDTAHGLLTGRYILITSVTGSDPEVNGNWEVTRVDDDTFTIDVDVITPGTGGNWSTLVTDFQDIKGCYNIIIGKLNSDSGVSFNNYQTVEEDTQIETVVNDVNYIIDEFEVADVLPFIQGPITVYKAIQTAFVYEPNTMGDSLGFKHCREASLMFENKAFTRAVASFSTDLQPEVQEIEFNGDGNGIFGANEFGSGFFGGASNAAPFRTYIPRQCQRCRYMSVGFRHAVAREQWAMFGTTLTAEVGQSTRAYR